MTPSLSAHSGFFWLRRRRKRKRWTALLLMLLWLGLSVMVLVNHVLKYHSHSSPAAAAFHEGMLTSYEDRSGQRTCFGSTTLPASVQLHCRMYHDDLISGDLCAPLCDLGHVCDLTTTYGHAHKEVMVAQCHHSDCGGQGHHQSVKAVLKHDESSSSPGGYEHEYNRMKAAGNQSDNRGSLVRILQQHLPARDIQPFLDSHLQALEVGVRPGDAAPRMTDALYNSLVLLFRQKEYVLFQAYSDKRVFPKVYGTCGPLYLVEYCSPLLQASAPGRENPLTFHAREPSPQLASRRTRLRYDVGDEEYGAVERFHSAEGFIAEKWKEPTSSRRGFVHKLLVSLNLLDDKADDDAESEEILSKDRVVDGISERQRFQLTRATQISQADFLSKDREGLPRGASKLHDHRPAVTVFDLNPNTLQRSGVGGRQRSPLAKWRQRVSSAVSILRFLRRLERADMLTEHVHLCDPKLEHFAVSAGDLGIRLVDADLVLFDSAVTGGGGLLPEASVSACAEHEDCSDVMCRGWCDKGRGRCERVRTNNNLQGICLNVFLRPSLQFGPLFVHVPRSVYDDVTKALCNCATNATTVHGEILVQKPSGAVRENLVQVLERSLSAGGPVQTGTGDGFLLGDC